MSKNPVLNGIVALAYIFFVSTVMNLGSKMAPKEDSFLAPLALISLFTLSAAVMGYIFCFQPLQLFLDGKKKAAVNLFLHTLLVFGGITALLLTLLFSGVFS